MTPKTPIGWRINNREYIPAPGRVRWALARLRGERDMLSYAVRLFDRRLRYQPRGCGVRHTVRWAAYNSRVFAGDAQRWLARPVRIEFSRALVLAYLGVTVALWIPAVNRWLSREKAPISWTIAVIIAAGGARIVFVLCRGLWRGFRR
jgi:hypothetical protein